jgi:hypothetical protein
MAKCSASDDENCWPTGSGRRDNPCGTDQLGCVSNPWREGIHLLYPYEVFNNAVWTAESVQLKDSLSTVVTLSWQHGAKCMTNKVFWDWSSVDWQSVTDVSEELAAFIFRVVWSSWITKKMDAARSSKMLVTTYQVTQQHIPEQFNFQQHCDNFRTQWRYPTMWHCVTG